MGSKLSFPIGDLVFYGIEFTTNMTQTLKQCIIRIYGMYFSRCVNLCIYFIHTYTFDVYMYDSYVV